MAEPRVRFWKRSQCGGGRELAALVLGFWGETGERWTPRPGSLEQPRGHFRGGEALLSVSAASDDGNLVRALAGFAAAGAAGAAALDTLVLVGPAFSEELPRALQVVAIPRIFLFRYHLLRQGEEAAFALEELAPILARRIPEAAPPAVEVTREEAAALAAWQPESEPESIRADEAA